eukprot:943954-Lingulodinium_polyedra.AAC.1
MLDLCRQEGWKAVVAPSRIDARPGAAMQGELWRWRASSWRSPPSATWRSSLSSSLASTRARSRRWARS